ncbi:MAG: Rab family GTPase [Acidimicrobiales bacterium]
MDHLIRKKICLLGAPAVGKSSLVRQFVHSLFSDTYASTIGVKIERKPVVLASGEDLSMIIWDVHGEAGPLVIPKRFLRGTSGFLVVVDATRPETLTPAVELRDRVFAEVGEVPFLALWNKSDLIDEPLTLTGEAVDLAAQSATGRFTSAKTGAGVEDAFLALAEAMVRPAEA